jgi:hypothetical protein
MICALMLDLDDSPDFPGSGGQALGRPLAAYPFMASRATGDIRRYYVVTGTPPVKAVALQNNAVIIDPAPAANGSPGAAAETQLRHGFKFAAEDLKNDKETLDLLVVFFANAPCLTGEALQGGLDAMQARPELDGAVTVSPMPRWNPFFARRESENGLLEPYVAAAPAARGEPLYPDYGAQLLRPRCLDGTCSGTPPFPWLGKNVLPVKQWGAGPVDYKWQVPAAEYWLKHHGYSDISANYELQPQPKLQPKSDRR